MFVAGWGKHSESRCTTNEHGPAPHVKCKFPFKFKFMHSSGCIKMQSPSKYEEVCSKLQACAYNQRNDTLWT